eukprot:222411-Pyramimonas_sp.AAC.1
MDCEAIRKPRLRPQTSRPDPAVMPSLPSSAPHQSVEVPWAGRVALDGSKHQKQTLQIRTGRSQDEDEHKI